MNNDNNNNNDDNDTSTTETEKPSSWGVAVVQVLNGLSWIVYMITLYFCFSIAFKPEPTMHDIAFLAALGVLGTLGIRGQIRSIVKQ
jgi:uncharacterized membrane protein YbhN (UPF0104 family)